MALSAAIAHITGYRTAKSIMARSLLTSEEGWVTFQFNSPTAMDSTTDVWNALRRTLSEAAVGGIRGMTLSTDSMVGIFDVQAEHANAVAAVVAAALGGGSKSSSSVAALGCSIVMARDKSGMEAGDTADIEGENRTQWKLSNGKSIQKTHEGDFWTLVPSTAHDAAAAPSPVAGGALRANEIEACTVLPLLLSGAAMKRKTRISRLAGGDEEEGEGASSGASAVPAVSTGGATTLAPTAADGGGTEVGGVKEVKKKKKMGSKERKKAKAKALEAEGMAPAEARIAAGLKPLAAAPVKKEKKEQAPKAAPSQLTANI